MIRKVGRLRDGSGVKIMSYNVLAQCLVRRDQFPTSGNYLRWSQRSKSFAKELEAYDPDVLVLQEVDNDHKNFWKLLVEKLGMHIIFHAHKTKKHGLAVCFKTAKFSAAGQHTLDFDQIQLEGVPRQCSTNNIALFIHLRSMHGPAEIGNLLIGTGHLYWHPDASYERSRQLLCVLNAVNEFKQADETAVFAGDCNSEYFDPSYLLLTGCMYAAKSPPAEIMLRSTAARTFDMLGAVHIENGIATEKPREQKQGAKRPASTNPSTLADGNRAVACMESAYRQHPLRATSMYGSYSTLPGCEASEMGEPLYTNWTELFKGTLDYIFCIHEKESPCPAIPLKLLEVPSVETIGASGCPKPAVSPSDHICIMAEVQLHA